MSGMWSWKVAGTCPIQRVAPYPPTNSSTHPHRPFVPVYSLTSIKTASGTATKVGGTSFTANDQLTATNSLMPPLATDCQGKELEGQAVWVFWPGMRLWYHGTLGRSC